MGLFTLLDICAKIRKLHFISERSRLDMHRPNLQINRENKHEEVTSFYFEMGCNAMRAQNTCTITVNNMVTKQTFT